MPAHLVQAFAQHIQRAFQVVFINLFARGFPAYRKHLAELRDNPLRMFISCDHDDEEDVRKLFGQLKGLKYIEAWLALDKLKDIPKDRPEQWEPPLMEALRAADCVVVCASPELVRNRSYYFQKELPFILKKAQEGSNPSFYVLVAKIQPCTTPKKLTPYLEVKTYEKDGLNNLIDVAVEARKQFQLKRVGAFQMPRLY